jgi:transcriptional regulator with XRE-family HTH domain
MKTKYTEKELKQLIIDRIKYGVTQKSLAKELGISQGYLSDFLAGKRGIGTQIVKALGFEQVFIRRSKCSKD